MNLDEYRMVFVAGSLVLMLIAATPTVSLFMVVSSGGGERFSELWLLGPNHLAGDYPFNVDVNETYRVFAGVGNHLGGSSYYLVYVKFRNQTQPLPDVSGSTPSSLPSLYEFRFFIEEGETWESLLTFAFQNVSLQGNSVFVSNVSINDVTFSVNSYSMWDSENQGFHYQLFFELWLYDITSRSFQYHNRFVGIWLNMTSS